MIPREAGFPWKFRKRLETRAERSRTASPATGELEPQASRDLRLPVGRTEAPWRCYGTARPHEHGQALTRLPRLLLGLAFFLPWGEKP